MTSTHGTDAREPPTRRSASQEVGGRRTTPPRLTRAAKQAQTRAHLVEAAASVFARRGFQSATIEEIAEEAGYSHGAVYSNFAGKEELFLAVFEQYMSQRVEEVARAAEIEGSFAERARAGADQWMQRFADDRDTFLLHLEFMIHAARNPHLSQQLGQRMAALRLEIERQLSSREALSDSALPLPAADLALILRALGIGLAVEALNQPGEINTGLYGDFVALVAGLLESA
ncbi:MAG TPA: TetR/AcrR family transcriptional regulator [Solirubrobacteraceae bacterium]|nr:TetR/AcrR family transcriptional regulator [Solirubrobacteraceae bacterium]